MKSLLILSPDLGVGGVQRKIVDIVNFLSSKNLNFPIFVLLAENKEFSLSSQINNPNVKIIYSSNLTFPFTILLNIWRHKPFAVLSFIDYASIPPILAKLTFHREMKMVASEDHFASKVIPNFKFGHIRNLLIKVFYPFADFVFTCSQANKADLIRNYSLQEHKIKIIKNWTTFGDNRHSGVPPEGGTIESHEILSSLRSSRMTKKEYDLIYIGRFYWTKNLEFLIKALVKIKKSKPNIRLCLVGEGEEEKSLRLLVNKYDLIANIEFVKPVLNVSDYLSKSKVLVLSSHTKVEGLPMIILEAMATGTPVLTRDFAGAKEFFKENKNCFLFKKEEDFIEKVFWLLENKKGRSQIALKAKKYVNKFHTSQNILDYFEPLGII